MFFRRAAVLTLFVVAAVVPLAADETAPSKSSPQEKLIKDLRSASIPAARIKAAESLGAEGENGQWAAADLCAVMLDRNPKVRKAATDALQKIDPKLHAIAVPVIVDEQGSAIQHFGEDWVIWVVRVSALWKTVSQSGGVNSRHPAQIAP